MGADLAIEAVLNDLTRKPCPSGNVTEGNSPTSSANVDRWAGDSNIFGSDAANLGYEPHG